MLRSLHVTSTRARELLALGFVAVAVAVAGEVGRVLLKGQAYSYSTFNDIHFYTAMAFNLWGDPVRAEREVAALGFNVTPQEWSTFFGGADTFWEAHVHVENGLSHQPPWAYRILVPSLAGVLRGAGIPLEWAFGVIYVASAVLLVLSVYLVLKPHVARPSWAAVVSLGTLAAAVASTSSGYPDMTFLGLAALSTVFAYRGNGPGFAVAGCVAGLARETALLLVVMWLLLVWVQRRWSWTAVTFAVGPLVGVLVSRIAVDVPNGEIDVAAMVRDVNTWPQVVLWSLVPALVIGLVSPRIMRAGTSRVYSRPLVAEVIMWIVGVAFVVASGLFGLASVRMALLALPLFLAPLGWCGARSPLWLVSAVASTAGYALSDTLAFRGDPTFGNIPWLVSAMLVAGLQGAAVIRDRRASVEDRFQRE